MLIPILDICLVNVLFLNVYLMISESQIYLREHYCFLQLIKKIINPRKYTHVVDGHLIQILVINAYNEVPSFFFKNNIGALQGDRVGLTYPLSRISFNCNFKSTNYRVLILNVAFDASASPGTNSMENSTSLCGGNYEIFAANRS